MPPSLSFDLAADGSDIDEEAGEIRGFSVMELGEINADGLHAEADAATLQAVERLANEAVESVEVADRSVRGVKMRLGHPQMSSDAITTTMAAARNFRVAADGRVRADLKFLEAADPKAQEHLMKLARQRPDFLAASLVVSGKEEKRLNGDGTTAKDGDGAELLPLFRPSFVHGVDFVDKGAATASGFLGTTALLSAEAAEQLFKISSREDFPDRVRRFVRLIDQEHPGTGDQLREALAIAPPGETMDDNPKKPAPEPETAHATEEQFDMAAAAAKLRASGYDVGEPQAAPRAGSKAALEEEPTPDAAELLHEMSELKATVAELKKQAEQGLADAATARLAIFKSRLEAILHLDSGLREHAMGNIATMLAAPVPDTEGAEKLTVAYESMPNVTEMAHLDTEFSVPYTDDETGKMDISRYKELEDSDEGARSVVRGDRDAMATAAAICLMEDPADRQSARLKEFKGRSEGSS